MAYMCLEKKVEVGEGKCCLLEARDEVMQEHEQALSLIDSDF